MSGHLGVGGGGGVETHDCRVFFRVSGFKSLTRVGGEPLLYLNRPSSRDL